MSEELKRDEILSAGPADGDWTDVLKRAKRTHRRQVSAAVVLTALVVVGAASAYALTHRGQPWCKEPASNAWNKVLVSHVVALSRRAAVTPLAVADDGHSFYAVLDSSRYSGIVKIDAGTSRYKEIQRISRPSMFKAEGTANGRWFVWADRSRLSKVGSLVVGLGDRPSSRDRFRAERWYPWRLARRRIQRARRLHGLGAGVGKP